MSDLPEKAPIRHEQVQRSKTVEGLFDDSIRGVNKSERLWSITELTNSTDNQASDFWDQAYRTARETLQHNEHSGKSPEMQAQSAVMLHQFDHLSKLGLAERKNLVQSLMQYEKTFSGVQEAASKAQQALRVGNSTAAIELQHKVIQGVDSMNQKILAFELSSVKSAREKSNNTTEINSVLDRAVDDTCATMAAPFVERARQAAFLSNDKKPYQAEKMLAEAMKTQIPSESMDSTFVKELRKNAAEQLSKLKVENHLLELYDSNLAKFDFGSKEGVITQEELNDAKAKSGDENFVALANFLSENFKYLTRSHYFTLFGKDGIKRSDIVDWEKERSKSINDLKI